MSDAKDGVILNRADGATLKNVKSLLLKVETTLKMQNVTNVTVGDKQYKKVGNQAESYKFLTRILPLSEIRTTKGL